MITLRFRTVTLTKRYPLAISRGTQAGSESLFVTAADGAHEGLGEMAPAIGSEWTAESGREQLAAFAPRDSERLESPHAAWALGEAREPARRVGWRVRSLAKIPVIMDTAGFGTRRGPYNCKKCNSGPERYDYPVQHNSDYS